MKTLWKLLSLITALTLSAFAPTSHAALVLHWSFDQTVYTVSSTDPIWVTATLFNSSVSDEHLITSGAGANFTGDLQKLYDFRFLFENEFVGLDLAPGESLHFNWGRLTPIQGFVPAGTYQSDLAFISLNETLVYPDSGFEVVVQPGDQPPLTGVPEPATLPFVVVLSVGILSGASWKRRRRTLSSLSSAA